MTNIAVFASGIGSNFDKISAYFSQKSDSRIKLLVTDNSSAGCVTVAENYKIPVFFADYKTHGKKYAEYLIADNLKKNEIDLAVLAGFMRILSSKFLNDTKIPIINIHPSLLPAFKGKNSITRAYESSEKLTGITIHFVNDEVDDGEIIFQKSVMINREKPVSFLENEIHKLEHENYPDIISKLCHVINKKKGECVEYGRK